jgi:hypothetical protein
MDAADNRARCYNYGSSRYRGVRLIDYNSGRQRATAFIFYQNKQKYIGTFDSEEEAARNYDLAAVALRGAKAAKALNFPENFEEYERNSAGVADALLAGGSKGRVRVGLPRGRSTDDGDGTEKGSAIDVGLRSPSLSKPIKRERPAPSRGAAPPRAKRPMDATDVLAWQVSRAAAATIGRVSLALTRALSSVGQTKDVSVAVTKEAAASARVAVNAGWVPQSSVPHSPTLSTPGVDNQVVDRLAPLVSAAMKHSLLSEAVSTTVFDSAPSVLTMADASAIFSASHAASDAIQAQVASVVQAARAKASQPSAPSGVSV